MSGTLTEDLVFSVLADDLLILKNCGDKTTMGRQDQLQTKGKKAMTHLIRRVKGSRGHIHFLQKYGKVGGGAVTPQKMEKSTSKKGLLSRQYQHWSLKCSKCSTHKRAAMRMVGERAATA